MREFKETSKTFIKSNNTTSKIFNRYLYCLIPFILFIIIYNLIWGNSAIVINLIKSTVISFLVSFITQYVFNAIKKEKDISKIFLKDHILALSLILGLFSLNSSILVIIISSLVSAIMKNILKNTTISSSLYGILIILITSHFANNIDTPLTNLQELSYINSYEKIVKPYGSILSYTLGLKYYLNPVLALISFIYLFIKKSIKYNIVISYFIIFTITMLSFGLLNNMNIWYLLFQLTTGNILFLIIFCGADYPNTPITSEGQTLYGIILGIITCILRFIIPELAIVIPLIIGPLLLTKIINRISFKLRYNHKFYHLLLIICIFALILTNIIINIIL